MCCFDTEEDLQVLLTNADENGWIRCWKVAVPDAYIGKKLWYSRYREATIQEGWNVEPSTPERGEYDACKPRGLHLWHHRATADQLHRWALGLTTKLLTCYVHVDDVVAADETELVTRAYYVGEDCPTERPQEIIKETDR